MLSRSFSVLAQSSRLLNMPSNEGVALSHRTDPFKVLVIGGSYGGLASIVNLLDLCNSRSPRTAAVPPPITSTTKVPIDITIVDERDGFCEHFPKTMVSHRQLISGNYSSFDFGTSRPCIKIFCTQGMDKIRRYSGLEECPRPPWEC